MIEVLGILLLLLEDGGKVGIGFVDYLLGLGNAAVESGYEFGRVEGELQQGVGTLELAVLDTDIYLAFELRELRVVDTGIVVGEGAYQRLVFLERGVELFYLGTVLIYRYFVALLGGFEPG